MINIFEKGMNNRLIVTFHGTGGNATQLFDIARMIDPESSLLGIQGDVLENGMTRYFERYSDGSFNTKSLAKATQSVFNTLKEAISKYHLETHSIVLLGYSNGANILQSLLKTETLDTEAVLLFHPATTLPELPFLKQETPVFITYGKGDFYISDEGFEDILRQLNDAEIKSTVYTSSTGHQLTQEEITNATQFLKHLNA